MFRLRQQEVANAVDSQKKLPSASLASSEIVSIEPPPGHHSELLIDSSGGKNMSVRMADTAISKKRIKWSIVLVAALTLIAAIGLQG